MKEYFNKQKIKRQIPKPEPGQIWKSESILYKALSFNNETKQTLFENESGEQHMISAGWMAHFGYTYIGHVEIEIN